MILMLMLLLLLLLVAAVVVTVVGLGSCSAPFLLNTQEEQTKLPPLFSLVCVALFLFFPNLFLCVLLFVSYFSFLSYILIYIYIEGSPSGCVLRDIPGVTQVEKGHAGNTAVATAYLCRVKHGHRSSRTGVPADCYF